MASTLTVLFFFSRLQKRTDKDKLDLMTFKEIRERLANRDAIRERQDLEERAEAERELLLEKAKRAEERAAAKVEQQPQDAVAEAAPPVPAVAAAALAPESMDTTTTAAADTSSEVAKKVKERFKKDTSKVIVRVLDPYRRPDAARGRIKSNEDFKHLAKKVARLCTLTIFPKNREIGSFTQTTRWSFARNGNCPKLDKE